MAPAPFNNSAGEKPVMKGSVWARTETNSTSVRSLTAGGVDDYLGKYLIRAVVTDKVGGQTVRLEKPITLIQKK